MRKEDFSNIYDQAKAWKKSKRILRGANDWQEAKTDFEKNKLDIQLSFDQNLNPKEISEEQEKQLRFVMQTVQQQATSTFQDLGADFTHDPELWIQFFARYPLLFNFRSRESKEFNKADFTLSTDTDFISDFLGANSPKDVADAFIASIKKASGKTISASSDGEKMQYLGIIRSYDKASTLTIYRAELQLEVKRLKTVCAESAKETMHIKYDKTVLEINNMLALALYPSLMETASGKLVEELRAFFQQLAENEFRTFNQWLSNPSK